MEEQKITADQDESEASILQNEDQDNDSKVDDRELISKTKLIEEDIKAKFERYTELIKDIPELKQLEENMQPCELQIQDDLDKISSDLGIEFDPANVSKIIKKGRQQLGDKKSEYDKKNQDLEAALRLLKQEDIVISQRNESYSQLVNNTEGLRKELIKKQKEATDLMADCDTDKEKFATKYAECKKVKEELENIEKKVLIRMSKQKGIVETCNDLIKAYRAQSKISSQKEESKQASEKPFDITADSICKDSSRAQDCWDAVKASVTNMVDNKNKEIQNAKENSSKEKKNLDLNIKESINLKNEAEVSLKTINQKIKTIDKYIEDCKNIQLSQKIDATYDYTKLILEPFKNIQTKDHDLKQPKFSLKEIDKDKQVRETEFKALAEVQSDLRELMVQGERNNQVKSKMQDKLNQIEIIRQTINDSEDKINGWNSKLEKKKEEKVNIEKEIEQNETQLFSTYKDNSSSICESDRDCLKQREADIMRVNSDLLNKKENIYKQLIEETYKCATLKTQLKTEMQKDCSKLLRPMMSYMNTLNSKSSKTGISPDLNKILSKYIDKTYFKLKHFAHNKKSEGKVMDICNSKIYTVEVVNHFGELESMFEEIKESKGETEDQDFQDEEFRAKLYYPLEELLLYKQIAKWVENQIKIIDTLKGQLKDCILEPIDEFKISSKGSLRDSEIDQFKELKLKRVEELTKLIHTIKDLECNISYAQREIEIQKSMREKAKKEYAELNDDFSQIELKLNRIIKKISDYLSSKLQDKSLKKEINSDLSKVIEGDFKTKNIDNWINQICIQYIGLVDEAYSKSINEYKLNFEDHVKQVEQHYQSQFKGYKQETWKLIKQGCTEMDAINQKNITKFNEISKQISTTLQNITTTANDIHNQEASIGKSINKISDISDNIKQSFNSIHDTLANISDIADEASWNSLSKNIKELIEKSNENKTAVEDLFKHLEDEAKRKQYNIDKNIETQKETKKNIDAKVIKLTKLKGIGKYNDRKPGRDGVLNREQIKSKITEVNKTIREFNKNIEKYEQQLNECIQSKQKLNNLEVQLQAKKNKIQEMKDNHTDIIAKLKKKEKEFKDIEDKINKMNVLSIKYKNCEIIVRKNELINELTEAIVNPTDERYTDNINISKKIANKEGDMNCGENKELIKIHGRFHEGQAMMTKINNLSCQSVIYAFFPKYNKKNNYFSKNDMQNIIIKILDIVNSNEFDSVSIPEISTEDNNIPINQSAPIICKTIKSYINSNREKMKDKTIVLCCPHRSSTEFLKDIVNKHFKDFEDRSDGDEEQKGEDSDQSVQICRKCSNEINEIKHQANGKHLSICYRCYKKKKAQIKMRKEQVDEEINTKKKRKSIKKRESSISSEESKEGKRSKMKSSKSSNKSKSYQDDESNEDSGRDKKKKRGKKKKSSSRKEREEGEEDTIMVLKKKEIKRREGIMSDNEEDSM